LEPGATRFRVLARNEGPSCAWTFAEDSTGAIWIGGDGVARWQNGKAELFAAADGVPEGSVHNIYRDHAGTMWFGSTSGLSSWDGKVFTRHTGRTSVVQPWVRTIAETRDSTLWIGTRGGVLRYADGDF